ncbi:MAG: hypothetical protein JXA57_15675 [Armatimonadetes bacterium]|nr:hypothetical protein [Armatimonadota bacterium]
MARKCTICEHPERDSIDAALVTGEPMTVIAERYGVGKDAVRRHKLRHLSPALAGMMQQAQLDRRASLLERIETLIERAETMFATAADEGRFNQSLDVLKELRMQLELLGKASGELNDRPQVTVNLMQSPEWINVRAVIFSSLADYPEARASLSGRLLELEAKEP